VGKMPVREGDLWDGEDAVAKAEKSLLEVLLWMFTAELKSSTLNELFR